ncbi:Gamma-butyrobetaine dioxygenase [Acropora cervicornis]|uniref:Gamma-butyrobetaine dioxygenase n=1 Tax=Acropora cervicornis TaxID=6130 RepID=A0AAD9Q6A5_ACRCE|nr:Gamma-butyrobetaine dioxygenase [Acropora cervicornis]
MQMWLMLLKLFNSGPRGKVATKSDNEFKGTKFATFMAELKKGSFKHSFQVKAKYGANNLAYTTDWLPLHTDLPFLDYPPGVQVLHCIEQVPGSSGRNQFVDGFYVSKVLKEQDPKKFDVLSSTRLHFSDVGDDCFGEFDMQFARTTIEF